MSHEPYCRPKMSFDPNGDVLERMSAQIERSSHETLAIWAADCAEHVLRCFEDEHREDVRPRAAIDAARAWAHGRIGVADARRSAFAAHAAARDARTPDAKSAARAAGHAAATAHVRSHAAHAAAYARKAVGDAEMLWQSKRLEELSMRP